MEDKKVYYVGNGKEIIVVNGEVPSVRLSKEERTELKAKMYFDKQKEKAGDVKLSEYWMVELNMDDIIMDVYNKKLKGVDAINYVNDIIREAKLIMFG